MSTEVDKRVVEMQFDNKNFEANVSTTMSTLDKLKQKLNLSGASKGLEEINSSAKKFDISSMSSGLESVKTKFSALQVMGVTALANITNSAVNAGKRITSALTIDPIKTGFNEYETKIGAIQTIMSNTENKGTTMKDVAKVIDELNTYADKTIYNFSEMTRNIGTFTAAGVELEESASAIQGIANLAAASGSNSQQASTAMYQLSQALAAGSVKLQDWNSVVNAGMGGQKFQEALKATAKEHGVAVDDLIKKNGSFRESLQEGWITADILNETLNKFTVDGAKKYAKSMVDSGKWTQKQADALIKEAQSMEDAATKVKTFTQLWDTLKESAQSGWSQSWEIIIGDFEEAKELFTEISDTIGKMIGDSADARNKVLQGWKDLGGRKAIIDALDNAFKALLSIIKPIKEAFREIFPPTTAKQLADFSKKLRDLTAKFILNDKQAAKLKSAFKGLFSIIDIGVHFIKKLANGFLTIIKSLFGFSGNILDVTSSIGEFISGLRDSVKESNVFGNAIDKISGFIAKVITAIKDFGGPALGGLWSVIKKVGSKILEAVTKIFSAFGEALASGDINTFLDLVNKTLFAGILIGVKNFIKKITGKVSDAKGFFDKLKDAVSGISNNISGILDTMRKSLEVWQQNLKASILLKIAAAVGILAASLLVLSTIDKNKLEQSVSAITILFAELVGSMKILGSSKLSGTVGKISAMIGLSVSVFILASALKKLSSVPFDDMKRGIVGVGALLAEMAITMKILATDSKKSMKGTLSVIAFASAIKILSTACIKLSSLSWDEIKKGLAAVAGLILEIAAFTRIAKLDGKAIGTALGIVLIASAIKILESSVLIFAKMGWEKIGKGLSVIGGLLLSLGVFARLASNAKKIISVGIAMNLFALALKQMTGVFSELSKLSWEGIAKGILVIVATLGTFVGAIKVLQKSAMNTIMASGAIGGLMSVMNVMADAFERFEKMSWNGVAKGLAAIAGSLILLVAAVKIMGDGDEFGLLILSAALMVLASSISLLAGLGLSGVIVSLIGLAGTFTILGIAVKLLKPFVPTMFKVSVAIATLGVSLAVLGAGIFAIGAGLIAFVTGLATAFLGFSVLDWGTIVKGFVALAGALAILGIAAAILKPLTVSILSLSLVIASFGLACLSIGAGVSLIASGLNTLSIIGEDGAKNAGEAIKVMLTSILELIPIFIKKLGEGVIELLNVFKNAIPQIGGIIKSAILTIIYDVLVPCVPAITDGALKILVGVMEALVKYTPILVELLFNFIIGVLDAAAKKLPALVNSVVNFLMVLFKSVIDALSNVDFSILIQGIAGVGLMAAIMYALAGVAALTPAAMVGVLGVGAVIAELSVVLAAIGGLAQIPGLDWLINEAAGLMKSIGRAIGSLIGGIIGGIAEGVTSSLPNVADNLSSFMKKLKPFIDGATKIDPSMLRGVKSLAGVITVLTAASVIDGISSWLTGGGSSLSNFGKQLIPFGKSMASFSETISGNIDEKAVEAASKSGKILAKMAATIPNSGGLAGLFAGENDLVEFAKQLVPFGEAMVEFSSVVSDSIDEYAVEAAANAGKMLAELAETVPNTGGVVSWFTGDNDLASFGTQVVAFGDAMNSFATSVADIDEDAVTTAANAGQMLVKLAETVPNTGGLVSWFTGDNDLTSFGEQIVAFGIAISSFSDTIKGKIDEDSVTAAANAGKTMVGMQSTLPNTGGVVQFFTGEQDMATFGAQLVVFGNAITKFSETVSGKIDEDAVIAAANAGKTMAGMQATLPNTGGVVSFFTGEQDMASFGQQLVPFGNAMVEFSSIVAGKIDSEAVTAAANAGKAMAEMQATLPNTGGVISWFAGEQNIASFGLQLRPFGEAMADFSTTVSGKIDAEAVTAAANAGKALAEMQTTLPENGGIFDYFTGVSDMASFGTQIESFGTAITKFSETISGKIDNDAVTAASTAGKTLAEMQAALPKEGSIFDYFTGVSDMDSFSTNIEKFGEAMAKFSKKVSEENIDPAKVTAAANAGKIMAGMIAAIPDSGGFFSWFTGDIDLDDFSENVEKFGEAMSGFGSKVKDINVKKVEAGADAGKTLADMTKNGEVMASFFDGNMDTFKTKLPVFGEAIKGFSDKVAKINVSNVKNGVTAAKSVTTMISEGTLNTDFLKGDMKTFKTKLVNFAKAIGSFETELSKVHANKIKTTVKNIKNAISTLNDISVKGLDEVINAFSEAEENVTKSSKSMISSALKAITDKESDFEEAGKSLGSTFKKNLTDKAKSSDDMKKSLSSAIASIEAKYEDFKDAGKYLGKGLIKGIEAKEEDVYNASYKLGQKAVQGEKDGQKSNSPSKLTIQSGKWFGEGLVIGIDKMGRAVYKAGYNMGDIATKSISKSISNIADLVNTDLDSQPTIRPVVDLSDVSAGANTINGMFSMNPSVGVMSNVRSINSMMNNNQNGNSELLSAVKGLRDDLASSSNGVNVTVNLDYNAGADANDIANDIATSLRRAIRRGV